jgi:hypothetical protein
VASGLLEAQPAREEPARLGRWRRWRDWLSRTWGRMQPGPRTLESHFTKLGDEEGRYGDAWEPVLQTFELPLAAFVEADHGFDPAALREIRLVFDRTPEGVVILDDLGFAR